MDPSRERVHAGGTRPRTCNGLRREAVSGGEGEVGAIVGISLASPARVAFNVVGSCPEEMPLRHWDRDRRSRYVDLPGLISASDQGCPQ
jgi:hypothetical protein